MNSQNPLPNETRIDDLTSLCDDSSAEIKDNAEISANNAEILTETGSVVIPSPFDPYEPEDFVIEVFSNTTGITAIRVVHKPTGVGYTLPRQIGQRAKELTDQLIGLVLRDLNAFHEIGQIAAEAARSTTD